VISWLNLCLSKFSYLTAPQFTYFTKVKYTYNEPQRLADLRYTAPFMATH